MKRRPAVLLTLAVWLAAPLVAEEKAPEPYRSLDPELTVYLDLPDGRVVLELSPKFAPKHVRQFLRLVRAGFYDGLTFYRVIDGFVAQGGDGSDLTGELGQPTLPAEFERSFGAELAWTPVQAPDLFAPETGFVDGFAAARDRATESVWLVHCPGVLALARNNEADSASTDFYIVIGQAPRYLDRNLTIFGRVVHGMEWVQRILRGPKNADGVIEDAADRTKIVRAVVAADLPEEERLPLSIVDTTGSEFAETLRSRRHRDHAFFHRTPPVVLDVCQVPVATRLAD